MLLWYEMLTARGSKKPGYHYIPILSLQSEIAPEAARTLWSSSRITLQAPLI